MTVLELKKTLEKFDENLNVILFENYEPACYEIDFVAQDEIDFDDDESEQQVCIYPKLHAL